MVEIFVHDFMSTVFGTTQLPFVEAVELVQVNQYGQKQNMPLTGLREKESSTYSVYSLFFYRSWHQKSRRVWVLNNCIE